MDVSKHSQIVTNSKMHLEDFKSECFDVCKSHFKKFNHTGVSAVGHTETDLMND